MRVLHRQVHTMSCYLGVGRRLHVTDKGVTSGLMAFLY